MIKENKHSNRSDDEHRYYLIKQKVNDQFYSNIKIPSPVNLKLFAQLLKTFVGYVQVWLIDGRDNSKKNLTLEYGNTEFNLHKFAKDHEDEFILVKVIFALSGGSTLNEPIYFYTISDYTNDIPKKFFAGNIPCALAVHIQKNSDWKLVKDTKSYSETKKIVAGAEYEKFIGKKYEEQQYNVIYNGLLNSVNDQGIDLICQKENSLVLVQCKNWITLENFKITSKDIRAFLGDCYLYLLQNNIKNIKVGLHFIVADKNMLDSSAIKYLENHPLVRYKVVEYEIRPNMQYENLSKS